MTDQERSFLDSRNFELLKDPTKLFKIIKLCGTGTYGSVYKALHIQTKTEVAVKVMLATPKTLEDNKNELEVLRMFSEHSNIATFFGAFMVKDKGNTNQSKLWVVMEYCGAGSANDLIRGFIMNGKTLKIRWCIYILRQMLYGLEYLHKNLIIHRDIKSQNVMLNKHGGVKLVDFGISSILTIEKPYTSGFIGTPYWMAPEVILCQNDPKRLYDTKCDIWSIGITAIELIDGFPPHSEKDPMQAMKIIPHVPPPRLKTSTQKSSVVNSFVKACLTMDYNKRPCAKTILEHQFFRLITNKEPAIVTGIVRALTGVKINKKKTIENIQKANKEDCDVAIIIKGESGIHVTNVGVSKRVDEIMADSQNIEDSSKRVSSDPKPVKNLFIKEIKNPNPVNRIMRTRSTNLPRPAMNKLLINEINIDDDVNTESQAVNAESRAQETKPKLTSTPSKNGGITKKKLLEYKLSIDEENRETENSTSISKSQLSKIPEDSNQSHISVSTKNIEEKKGNEEAEALVKQNNNDSNPIISKVTEPVKAKVEETTNISKNKSIGIKKLLGRSQSISQIKFKKNTDPKQTIILEKGILSNNKETIMVEPKKIQLLEEVDVNLNEKPSMNEDCKKFNAVDNSENNTSKGMKKVLSRGQSFQKSDKNIIPSKDPNQDKCNTNNKESVEFSGKEKRNSADAIKSEIPKNNQLEQVNMPLKNVNSCKNENSIAIFHNDSSLLAKNNLKLIESIVNGLTTTKKPKTPLRSFMSKKKPIPPPKKESTDKQNIIDLNEAKNSEKNKNNADNLDKSSLGKIDDEKVKKIIQETIPERKPLVRQLSRREITGLSTETDTINDFGCENKKITKIISQRFVYTDGCDIYSGTVYNHKLAFLGTLKGILVLPIGSENNSFLIGGGVPHFQVHLDCKNSIFFSIRGDERSFKAFKWEIPNCVEPEKFKKMNIKLLNISPMNDCLRLSNSLEASNSILIAVCQENQIIIFSTPLDEISKFTPLTTIKGDFKDVKKLFIVKKDNNISLFVQTCNTIQHGSLVDTILKKCPNFNADDEKIIGLTFLYGRVYCVTPKNIYGFIINKNEGMELKSTEKTSFKVDYVSESGVMIGQMGNIFSFQRINDLINVDPITYDSKKTIFSYSYVCESKNCLYLTGFRNNHLHKIEFD